jgi:small-conductance mechanosensitive channel
VRSFDNTHVIVPNSRLLEQSVTNLTLSDDVVRNRIRFGVAYGSPTREIERILSAAMAELDSIDREPEPQVRFHDFGDSALIFEAIFWSSIKERREVASELRHRIAEALERGGIVMAFPQRDVHLSTSKPLEIVINPPVELPKASFVKPAAPGGPES